uniref:Mitochondrial import inner membrane translocase subunit TIM50 n=1 Tax=Heterosigma akashiwo TaxID=2829 RepID=A0A6V1VU91_HETAK|mmetsp:Transcript_41851/g.72124  ORF Transcript_41851/g.72124 Transcript_41851/m.72124 type:complete len:240 (-) Transcript_41851:207-926(-)
MMVITAFLWKCVNIMFWMYTCIISVGILFLTVKFCYIARKRPLHLVWDLDATIISSHLIKEEKTRSMAANHSGYFAHIDDDFPFDDCYPNTYTWFRPHARWVLWVLSFFTVQHVFTAAQKSYTNNILERLDPKRKLFKIVLHRNHFPEGHFSRQRLGKDVLLIVEEQPLLARTILFDDRERNFKHRPLNGLLVRPYKDIDPWDWEMLRLLCACIWCHFTRDVRDILPKFNGAATPKKIQ